MNSLFSLDGRVALVTGASGTLGGHFARVLHQAGARVALAARRVEAVPVLGEGSVAVALDVTRPDSVIACFAAAEAAFGAPCDIIVNNAGIAVTKPVLDMAPEDYDSVLDVNLRGCFLVAQEGARRLVAGKAAGSIINIASILGLRIIPGVAGYTSAKAGLLQMTRQMAVEFARYRIRVNAIAPGYIASDINAGFFESEPGQAMLKRVPQRRLGTPEDLTGPLLLLASAAGAHMTGSTITVDGGHSINSL